jgi:hypothetical protein
VDAKLCPRNGLAELLKSSEAAGHRHECIREGGHRRLTVVHGVHDAEVGQRAVRELARDERVRDHPDCVTTCVEYRVCDDTHQTHTAASEDEADPAACHLAAKLHCCLGVLWVVPRT